jgi:integrative and conjugative element protein (TIGR02256 family)
MTAIPVVYVAESVLESVSGAARDSHPFETGGVLLGVRAGGRAWVTAAVEIPAAARSHTSYRIPAGSTQSVVRAMRRSESRVGYLGDWHSHPMDSPASRVDRITLVGTAIATLSTSILMVVRKSFDSYEIDLLQAHGLAISTCRISLTGNLPAPETLD